MRSDSHPRSMGAVHSNPAVPVDQLSPPIRCCAAQRLHNPDASGPSYCLADSRSGTVGALRASDRGTYFLRAVIKPRGRSSSIRKETLLRVPIDRETSKVLQAFGRKGNGLLSRTNCFHNLRSKQTQRGGVSHITMA